MRMNHLEGTIYSSLFLLSQPYMFVHLHHMQTEIVLSLGLIHLNKYERNKINKIETFYSIYFFIELLLCLVLFVHLL